VIGKRVKGVEYGTMKCPHCRKWIFLDAYSAEAIKKEKAKGLENGIEA